MTITKAGKTKGKKRGPKGPRGRPVNPARVHKIVTLRDEKNLSFSQIAQELGDDPPMTEQTIHYAYTRWAGWVRKNYNSRVRSPSRE